MSPDGNVLSSRAELYLLGALCRKESGRGSGARALFTAARNCEHEVLFATGDDCERHVCCFRTESCRMRFASLETTVGPFAV
jgi:hypothetical protein